MASTLLTTKLYAPPSCPTLVERPRLTVDLSKALTRRLTLVSAPAGYGKTTLVSSWLRETEIASAWLSLDEGDNDPIRFLQYFLSALHKIVPAIQLDLLDMLRGMRPAQADALLNCLINEIAENAVSFVLVLDDFHVIHAQPILEMLAFLFDHLPPQMHLVCLTRTDPDLPLARLRVRDQLVDIRAEQLRFTLDEIAVFLNKMMGLNLSADDLTALETRTEGWIAGLQLAALSLQGRQDIHSFVAAFTGSHAYIMDYLTEEVLKLQPESVRSFLLQTAILDRLCAPLCEAIVETDQMAPHQGQAMLEALEHMNLFVIPLDNERRWYRYHHLFADVLNRRLEHLFPQRLADLHRRASHWYEQNGFIAEATHHALLIGDQDRAIQLIEQNGCLLLIRGEVNTLQRWLEAIELQAQTRPWMYIFKAWLFTLTGYPERVEELLQTAEQLIPSSETSIANRTMQGTIETARAYQANLLGDTLLATKHARRALQHLPDADLVSRSLRTVATSLLGDASSMNGDLQEARQAYSEALRIAQAAGDVHLTIVLNSNIANILIEQGSLHEAARIYGETLQMATRPDSQEPVIAGRVYAELSQVSYEWNHLEAALQQVRHSMALCQQWGNIDQQAISYVMLARLEHVQHQPGRAQAAIRRAQQLVEEHHLLPRYSVWVRHALACLWIAQGDLEQASRPVQQSGIRIDDEIPYLREPEYLAWARVLLAQEDYEAALALIQQLLQKAEATSRMRRVIEVLVLQALIFQGRRDIDQALTVLERALSLARPEGYVRTFLDEGEQMAKLLHLAKARRIEIVYATELLSAMEGAAARPQAPAQLLAEPLSQRELEVLQLIEAGCSNQEIAARLFISIATVKRHISNIYAKLDVQNRTQAISIGRELNLLS
jgi:LuxR family maltose regulon positive regulatory protein